MKVIQRECFYIKASDISVATRQKLQDSYTFRFYEEKACKDCDYLSERHSDICDTCAAFNGGVQLSKPVTVKGVKYVTAPIGDKEGLEKVIGTDVEYRDKNPDKRIEKFKFTGELRDYQKEAVRAMRRDRRGIILAAPRSGKTVMSTAFICSVAKKTMILAAQRDWLVGFQETFVGSKTQKALTDIDPKRIGFARKYEDFLKYDVCLVTPQTFHQNPGLLLKIRSLFSICVIDEIQGGAANKYASHISKLNVQYMIGLSGTPFRKDTKEVIFNKLVGDIVFRAKVERLKPTVRLVKTQYTKNYKGNVPWTTMVSSLEKDPARLKLIAKWAIKDAQNGHMVLIPLSQVVPIKALVMTINKLAGKTIAKEFTGGLKKDLRDQTIEDARNYKIKILVGTMKLLSVGINIPRASCLYDVAMSSNKYNAEQRVARVLTPWDNKPAPLYRIFLDDTNIRRRCLANEWWQCTWPIFKPKISETDSMLLKNYFKATGPSQARMEF